MTTDGLEVLRDPGSFRLRPRSLALQGLFVPLPAERELVADHHADPGNPKAKVAYAEREAWALHVERMQEATRPAAPRRPIRRTAARRSGA